MKERNRIKSKLKLAALIFWGLGILIFAFSCEKYTFDPPSIDPGEEVSFQDVLQILDDQNCAACHPRVSPPDLSSDKAYEALLDGYVNIESPEESEIYTQFEGGHSGLNTQSIEIQKILNWITQGATDN